jgi:hypothetical protein
VELESGQWYFSCPGFFLLFPVKNNINHPVCAPHTGLPELFRMNLYRDAAGYYIFDIQYFIKTTPGQVQLPLCSFIHKKLDNKLFIL